MFDTTCLPKLALAMALTVTLHAAAEARTPDQVEPGSVAGKPGSIIRVWALEGGWPSRRGRFPHPLPLHRAQGRAHRRVGLDLHSLGASACGRPQYHRLGASDHRRRVVLRAVADAGRCRHDLGPRRHAGAGLVVTATDYPGLGTPGPHPYLIGVSEGRAVLDSVRAAQNLPSAGASNRFVVWGHSQGGHASLYAGELAAGYAPALKIVGVAAAAPATYLVELFDADASSATGKELTAMALYSWSALYGTPASTLVEPGAMGVYEVMAKDCIESVPEFLALDRAETPLAHAKFLKADPTETEPWRSIMLRNTPGQTQAGAPVFIAQGTGGYDGASGHHGEIRKGALPAGRARAFHRASRRLPHLRAKNSVREALRWMGDRFRGAPAPCNC